MSAARFVSASLTAALLAVAPVMLSASDDAVASKDTPKTTQSAPAKFAALKGVTAAPMSSTELKSVKGLHFHFMTPAGKLLFVNIQIGNGGTPTPNADPWSTEPFIVGKGYRGLCGAALNSPGLFIPGQSETTGIGGGC